MCFSADGEGGAGIFVVGQGERPHRDADDSGQQDRHGDMAQPLPRVGAEVVRGFLLGAVEAVHHGEHREQAERQGPGQLRAERRGEQAGLQPRNWKPSPMPKPTSRLGITRLAIAR